MQVTLSLIGIDVTYLDLGRYTPVLLTHSKASHFTFLLSESTLMFHLDMCVSNCDTTLEHVQNMIRYFTLMLLVGRQEGHPACKKTEWWDVGVVIWDEVQTCI